MDFFGAVFAEAAWLLGASGVLGVVGLVQSVVQVHQNRLFKMRASWWFIAALICMNIAAWKAWDRRDEDLGKANEEVGQLRSDLKDLRDLELRPRIGVKVIRSDDGAWLSTSRREDRLEAKTVLRLSNYGKTIARGLTTTGTAEVFTSMGALLGTVPVQTERVDVMPGEKDKRLNPRVVFNGDVDQLEVGVIRLQLRLSYGGEAKGAPEHHLDVEYVVSNEHRPKLVRSTEPTP